MYVFRSLLSFAFCEMFSEAKKRKETYKRKNERKYYCIDMSLFVFVFCVSISFEVGNNRRGQTRWGLKEGKKGRSDHGLSCGDCFFSLVFCFFFGNLKVE